MANRKAALIYGDTWYGPSTILNKLIQQAPVQEVAGLGAQQRPGQPFFRS